MIVPTLSTLVSVRFRCSDDLSAAGGENPFFIENLLITCGDNPFFYKRSHF